MTDEQVQLLVYLLNHYACLYLLLCPAYVQINRNFSQGDKTSTPPAALPVLHSGPHECQTLLLTNTMMTQLSNMQPASSQCFSATLLTSSPRSSHNQTPNGAQLPLQPFLESYAAILALLQSHSGLYCTLYL